MRSAITSFNIRTLVELGTWYGKSAVFFADIVDKLYCIDLWDESFIRNNPNVHFTAYPVFDTHPLFDTFLVNVWNKRETIIPMRMTTVEGLNTLKYAPFEPDAFYIDAEHTYDAVWKELNLIYDLFGGDKVIMGDDYHNGDFPSVVQAVDQFKALYNDNYTFYTCERCFFLVPKSVLYETPSLIGSS